MFEWTRQIMLLAALGLIAGCDTAGSSPVKPPPVAINDPAAESTGGRNVASTIHGNNVGSPGVPHSTATAATAEALFADWPKPSLAIVISGDQMGYIEPCGCAGLENQKGGLSRRHSFLKKLASDGWDLAALDLGQQVRRFGAQQEIKFHTTIEALRTMRYDAVGFGPDDLRLPVGEVIADVANEANQFFVSANLRIQGLEDFIPRYRVLNKGGKRLAVTAILSERSQQKINNDELAFIPPAKALAEIVPQMLQEADFLLLLSYGTKEESRALAEAFPQFHAVVTAGGADEPPAEAAIGANGTQRLIEVGHKGMYVAVLGLFDDPKQPIRYQRVPLDKRFSSSDAMHDLMLAYQGQLRERGFEGLGLRPVPHNSGLTFVGSNKCADCHTKAFAKWSSTPHAHATETLTNLDPPRQFDAECISCHATGWEPQKFFPFASGFARLEKTAHLIANGCENCHGPGSAHVAAESGESQADDSQLMKLRDQMRLTLDRAEASCRTCHDPDNSPEFDFKKYWPKVEHRGKD